MYIIGMKTDWISTKDELPSMSNTGDNRSKELLIISNNKIYIGYLQYDWLEPTEEKPIWILQGRDGYLIKDVDYWSELPDKPC
jgi:hypothetical protein